MKKLMLFILFIICLFSVAYGDSPATPTDLEEEYYIFEDDDYGHVNPNLLKRKVFLEFSKEPVYCGDEITLIAVLIDFHKNDIYYFEWEESEDGENWWTILDENKQTYTIIINNDNINHYWRVKVHLEE